jgi:hypothetical protein
LVAIAIALSLVALTGSAWAQGGGSRDGDFRIVRLTPAFVDTPDIQGGKKQGVMGGTPTKWLRVEVEFSSAPDWADNVDLRWYIQTAGDKNPVVFADSVTHINVKKGAHHYSVIFMPPRTVDRYAKNNRVSQIAVQLWHNQKLMDTGGWPSSPTKRWWEEFTPARGFLLNLLQTPFSVVEYDRYEQIRTPSSTP